MLIWFFRLIKTITGIDAFGILVIHLLCYKAFVYVKGCDFHHGELGFRKSKNLSRCWNGTILQTILSSSVITGELECLTMYLECVKQLKNVDNRFELHAAVTKTSALSSVADYWENEVLEEMKALSNDLCAFLVVYSKN